MEKIKVKRSILFQISYFRKSLVKKLRVRTAQRIREIVLSRLSVYIRVFGDKNDEPCRTHAKKYLNSICLQIHTDHVTFLFEKKIFCEKNVKNTLLFV